MKEDLRRDHVLRAVKGGGNCSVRGRGEGTQGKKGRYIFITGISGADGAGGTLLAT